MIGTSAELR